MIPIEKYTDAEHEATTSPSGIQNAKPADPPVDVTVEPIAVEAAPPRPIAHVVALILGTPILGICIADTVEFLYDVTEYDALYRWGVVMASAALGAAVALAAVKVRGLK